MEGSARALAHRASNREKLLARPQKLLVPDDRTGLLSSPGTAGNSAWIRKIPKANEVNCFHWDIDLVKLARLHN